jgi:ATP-dependent RNA helicase DeaD
MPPEIMRMAQEYMHYAKEVMLNQELSLDTIEQCYLIIREKEKFKHLCNIIKKREKKQTLYISTTRCLYNEHYSVRDSLQSNKT